MIKVIAVGRIKESFIQKGVLEYAKRLESFGGIRLYEVEDLGIEKEGERIMKALGDGYAVVLDVKGMGMSSEELASFIKKNMERDICFVVGGPEGLSKDVICKADMILSLSKMTFTHEMSRLLLLEQIYRAHMINSGRSYHK